MAVVGVCIAAGLGEESGSASAATGTGFEPAFSFGFHVAGEEDLMDCERMWAGWVMNERTMSVRADCIIHATPERMGRKSSK